MNGEEDKFGMGIATFMGGDYVTNIDDTENYDIAFLGVPVESGASYRRGQSLAANVLRKYSAWDRIDGSEYVDLDRDSLPLVARTQCIADLSDLVINESDPVGTIDKITHFSGRIASRCLPVFIGGDHSITYSTFQGAHSRVENARVGILHFDSHFDVEDGYPNMPRVWHGNVFRSLIDEGHIAGRDLFTVGVRGIVPKPWINYAEANRINYITASEVHAHEDDVRKKIQDGLAKYDYVYITLDVDSLDIAYCPGTGVPRSNGLLPREVVDITRDCIDPPILAIDIVEFSPQYDVNGQSAITICEMMYDFLAFRRVQ